jgi:hypothetical protein
MKLKMLQLALGASVLLSLNASAVLITGSTVGGRSAAADISLSGSTLTIKLINTGAAAHDPSDLLMALLFSPNAGVTFSPISASLGAGSTISYGSLINNIGEGWAYDSSLSAHGRSAGISAAGLGVFGQANFFSPPVTPLDGANYGIANGFNSPNTGITGNGPVFSNEVDFSLHVNGSLDFLAFEHSLIFQWGTALSEPFTPGNPPPSVPDGGSTVALLGCALAGIGAVGRKIRKA